MQTTKLRNAAMLCAVSSTVLFSQSIRKNYTEMTPEEQSALVAAFHALGDGVNTMPATPTNLIWDIAKYHSDHFVNSAPGGGIHTAPNEATNVFHAWHRYAAFELEQAMQKLYPGISLPYWDWTVNQSTTDALWSNTFLGQFNTSWALGRSLGGPLPTQSQVTAAQAVVDWWPAGTNRSNNYYTANIEGGTAAIHNNPHNWVKGFMSGTASPRDPVFWFHHNMIDKLWQDWEEKESAVKTSHTKTSMPRYDGTYQPYPFGTTPKLPLVDPDNIVDSRKLGVFYAGNKTVMLDKYTVANKTMKPERFVYKYTIQTGTGFIVPAGKSCVIKSQTQIVFNPGLVVDGNLTAEITQSSILAKVSAETEAQDALEMEQKRIEEIGQALAKNSIHQYLNGRNELVLEYRVPNWGAEIAEVQVTDFNGRTLPMQRVLSESLGEFHRLSFQVGSLTRGVYFYHVRIGKTVHSGQFAMPTDIQ